jgi:ABC-type enterochelin transport system substrate-binding protein
LHAAAGIAVTLALLSLAGCAQSTLDTKAVRNEAEAVESLAQEGVVLADQLGRDRLKESFAQVHAADLAELAASSEEGLEPSLATPELRSAVEQLQALAEDVSVQLRAIETAPRDDGALGAAGERLDELASEAEGIAGRL